MIHGRVIVALRAKLLTLSVCTTGAVTLSATATGYARATGSFLDDGFEPGMEVTPTGFVQTTRGVIEDVTALTMTIAGGRTASVAAADRTLAVGLPATQFKEGEKARPVAGVPYVVEQYIPGPGKKVTLTPGGELEIFPQYAPHIHVKEGNGIGAAYAYAGAIQDLFCADTSIPVTGGQLYVRGDVIPLQQQLLPSAPGFVVVPVIIPLRLQVANPV